jgi:O-antigen/teichoic acid export membrane protein
MDPLSDGSYLDLVNPAEPAEPAPEAPTTQPAPRRSVLFLAGSLAGGNLIAMAMRMIGGVLLGRLVAPSTLGLFAGIGLALGYAANAQLGILNGLNRELPFFMGKGDVERARSLSSAAQAWALAVGAAAFVGLTGVAIWQLAHGETWKAAGWLTNAVLAVFLFYGTCYLQITFRSTSDFVRLARVNVIEGATALVGLVFVAFMNFYGLCLRVVLAGAASTAMLHRWRPVRVGPRWNWAHLKHLLVIGAPIFGVGQVYGLWTGVINSTLVLRFTGTHGMGLFAMVLVAISALEVVPAAVGQVLYPRMAQEYGAGCTKRHLFKLTIKPMVATWAGLSVVVVAGWFAAEPLVHLVIPQYVEAVPAMQWALLLPWVNSFQPLNSVFNVVRRQDLYLGALALGIAGYAVSLLLLTRGTVRLAAFPQAMLVGRVIFMAVSYLLILYLQRTERPRETGATG